MSYFFGFRQGWIKLFGHGFGWYDARIYPNAPRDRTWGKWKVWFQ